MVFYLFSLVSDCIERGRTVGTAHTDGDSLPEYFSSGDIEKYSTCLVQDGSFSCALAVSNFLVRNLPRKLHCQTSLLSLSGVNR